VALCWGQTPETATIVTAHGRHPRDRIKFAAVEEGKRAVTHLRTFQHGRPEGTGQGGEVSLVGCRLETGRTHQIRVHLEHINHPVVGDPLYGAGRKRPSAWAPLLAGLDHQLLHAAELGFIHPATGEQMHFEGPPEDDFAALIARLGFVWPSSEALASI
jgi:23S rRNA pseudouridine1911/1915/1917 synthase